MKVKIRISLLAANDARHYVLHTDYPSRLIFRFCRKPISRLKLRTFIFAHQN